MPDAHIQNVGPGARWRVLGLKFAKVVVQTLKALIPELAVVADPVRSLLKPIGPKAAQVLAPFSALFYEPRPHQICNMF